MKKSTSLIIAALFLILPELKGQEPENGMEMEEPQAKTVAGKKTKKEPPKITQCSGQQKNIQSIMDKIKKARKTSEKRKLNEKLKREQNALKLMFNRQVQPLKDKINPLKERIRLSNSAQKSKIEEELATLEEQIKTLESDADLDTWCREVNSNSELSEAPDPGFGKRASKRKSKK